MEVWDAGIPDTMHNVTASVAAEGVLRFTERERERGEGVERESERAEVERERERERERGRGRASDRERGGKTVLQSSCSCPSVYAAAHF